MALRSARKGKKRWPRHPQDWYCEEPWVVEALFDMVPIEGDVYDPAAGRANIPLVAQARGHRAMASDLVRRTDDFHITQLDFLSTGPLLPPVDNIIMNPPYSYRKGIAEAFTRIALGLARGRVCICVPITWLSTNGRYRLYTERPPEQILIFSQRPSMPPGDKIAELGDRAFRGGEIDYMWVVWNNASPPPADPAIRWIRPREKAA